MITAKYGDYFRLLAPGSYEIMVDAPEYIAKIEQVNVKSEPEMMKKEDLVINFAMIPVEIDESAYLNSLNIDRILKDNEEDESDSEADTQQPRLTEEEEDLLANILKGQVEEAEPREDDVRDILNALKSFKGQPTGATQEQETESFLKMLESQKKAQRSPAQPKDAETLPKKAKA